MTVWALRALSVCLVVAGAACLVYGSALLLPAAGWIVAGALLLFVGFRVVDAW